MITIQLTTAEGMKKFNKLLNEGWEIMSQNEYEATLIEFEPVERKRRKKEFV